MLLLLLRQLGVSPTLIKAIGIVVFTVGRRKTCITRIGILTLRPLLDNTFGQKAKKAAASKIISRNSRTCRR